MSDYGEEGATPVEDAAIEDPPTVAEVAERQREEYPEQVRRPVDDGDGDGDRPS